MTAHDDSSALRALLASLLAAATFEEAASAALDVLLRIAREALEASPFAGEGRLVRGMVHLRPDDGYRGLLVREAESSRRAAAGASPAILPSATAWRYVVEQGRAVAIDVTVARVMLDPSDPKSVLSDRSLLPVEFASQESRLRLLHRDVTHLFVLPVRGPKGTIAGMISLEAACRAAMGLPFLWQACFDELQLLVDLAAPYLLQLPQTPTAAVLGNEFLPVVGASMAELVDVLAIFARQEEPILISGPTGAGKSRLARWCHERSDVADQPFEALDLAAIPEELQLAELFGWKKGAFTGAVRDNAGVLARAKGGTLFIDEIDNLSPRAQSGLLRVLEERKYRVLGDDGPERPADVRFIVGTNARLHEAVRAKRFREDLFYRINVLPVRLPSLHERPDEIPLWADYMATRRHEKQVPGGRASFAPEAHRLLVAEPWPGNLRQLDNIVRRAYALATMTAAVAPPTLVLRAEHVRQALAHESVQEQRSALDVLLAAAKDIVAEAARREADGEPLDLDLFEGFKGLVLGAAIDHEGGDRDAAFRALGKDRLVKARNHHKALRRELERAQSLWEALGGATPFPFRHLLSDGDPT